VVTYDVPAFLKDCVPFANRARLMKWVGDEQLAKLANLLKYSVPFFELSYYELMERLWARADPNNAQEHDRILTIAEHMASDAINLNVDGSNVLALPFCPPDEMQKLTAVRDQGDAADARSKLKGTARRSVGGKAPRRRLAPRSKILRDFIADENLKADRERLLARESDPVKRDLLMAEFKKEDEENN